jgi:hypothetical protein
MSYKNTFSLARDIAKAGNNTADYNLKYKSATPNSYFDKHSAV